MFFFEISFLFSNRCVQNKLKQVPSEEKKEICLVIREENTASA